MTHVAAGSRCNQLNITDPFNSADTQNCSYGYDDVTRIASANCGSAAAQTFTYDPFGNVNKSGSPYSFQPTYSSSTNRMTNIAGFTPSYDNNGNVTNDSLHTYTWNADGRPVTIDSVNLTYDALGRIVEQNRSGTYAEIVYAPTGQKIEIMNGQSFTKAFVPLPGGAVAEYTANELTYLHADWLGSPRLGSTPSRTVSFDLAYAPFGETYASSGSTDPAFTGQRQDTVSGLYDFPAREYSIQGRWPSPDPAGRKAVSLSNPQTWNRYAYVTNNPLRLVDPLGLDCLDAVAAIKRGRHKLHRGPRAADESGCNFGGGGGGGGGILDGGGGTNNGIGDLPLDANGGPGIDGMGLGLIVSDGSSSVAPNNLLLLPTDSVDSGQSQVLTPDTGPATYDEYVFQQLAPGVVQGAGVIGDPKYVAGFYITSAALGAVGSAGTIYRTGAAGYNNLNAFLGGWAAGDPAGFAATQTLLENLIYGMPPGSFSDAAAAGALANCILVGDSPCPGILNPH